MDPNREESFRKAGMATVSNNIAEHQLGLCRSSMTKREQVREISRCGSETEES